MKVRLGFVSNSSSSSFMCLYSPSIPLQDFLMSKASVKGMERLVVDVDSGEGAEYVELDQEIVDYLRQQFCLFQSQGKCELVPEVFEGKLIDVVLWRGDGGVVEVDRMIKYMKRFKGQKLKVDCGECSINTPEGLEEFKQYYKRYED